MYEMSRGRLGLLAADALLVVAALVFWNWPHALPVPNLDIIFMVIALVAVALTILGLAVTCLNRVAD